LGKKPQFQKRKNQEMQNPTQIFQQEIAEQLTLIYPQTPIAREWRSIDNIRGLYSPRIDVAVGPFSTLRGGNLREEYNQLLDNTRAFIERLLAFHRENVERYRILDEQRGEILEFPEFPDVRNFNNNARCLIAIEIEHQVSRKHLLGGAVNASVLGRLGVMVGWDEEKVNALVKLQAYWDFLRSVGKNTFETKNLIILSPEHLREAIRQSLP
jgi:hypothetical protein